MPAGRLNSNDSEATEVQSARSRRHKPKGGAPEQPSPRAALRSRKRHRGCDPQHQEGGAEGHQEGGRERRRTPLGGEDEERATVEVRWVQVEKEAVLLEPPTHTNPHQRREAARA